MIRDSINYGMRIVGKDKTIPKKNKTIDTVEKQHVVSPYGDNYFMKLSIRDTNKTYEDLANFLTAAITRPDAMAFYNVVRRTMLESQLKIADYYRQMRVKLQHDFAKLLWEKHICHCNLPGYTTRLEGFDEKGYAFFDSTNMDWKPVYDSTKGGFEWGMLNMIADRNANPTNKRQIPIFELSDYGTESGYILPSINPLSGLAQNTIMATSYASNHLNTVETIMARRTSMTHVPCTDPNYLALRYGFSARPVLHGKGNFGHYVCVLVRVLASDQKHKQICIGEFFLRLGLEQIIDSPFTVLVAHSDCKDCDTGDWCIHTR